MASSKGLYSELESFRRQWLSEVRQKQGPQSASSAAAAAAASPFSTRTDEPRSPKTSHGNSREPAPAVELHSHDQDEEAEASPPRRSFEDTSASAAEHEHTTVHGPQRTGTLLGKDLVSALDYYEEAMAKEAEGNMGDSLKLYRRAYRLDHRVDRRYREKHFPASYKPQPHIPAQPATATSTSPPPPSDPAPSASSPQTASPAVLLPVQDLIASFSNLRIQPAPPPVEDTPPAPCPIASLPRELLVHILHEVALHDVGDFVRLSLVCKPFAYLVPSQQHTWRHICLGTRFGFTGMHYHWHKTVEWTDLLFPDEEESVETPPSPNDDGHMPSSLLPDSTSHFLAQRRKTSIALSESLVRTTSYPSWKHMFRHRPRIRFNGCYISTVNYIRMGQASTTQATWAGSPVHIVTYYRYLRFFRDGTAISLLTTAEPSAVVAHLTREALLLHQADSKNTHAYLPSAVMHRAYRGRWRLSCPSAPLRNDDGHDAPVPSSSGPPRSHAHEGDLTVETETHDPKYMFRMDLSLRSAGKGARNNKLVWQSHYSYNKLTDDWAEFTLKHDKAFFFSRVRSYGFGG
ncbi:hypothetical protein E4U21_002425 [Claviceps maximensis]|nr:hypothetical protein E4U21_002425 [Claviceps maximensis]